MKKIPITHEHFRDDSYHRVPVSVFNTTYYEPHFVAITVGAMSGLFYHRQSAEEVLYALQAAIERVWPEGGDHAGEDEAEAPETGEQTDEEGLPIIAATLDNQAVDR